MPVPSGLSAPAIEVFLRKAAELGLKASFFASKNLYDAVRSSSAKDLFNGVCFTYPMEQLQRESDFRARYKAKFGEDARMYADNTYDALFILAKAIQDSREQGSSLKDASRAVTYDGLTRRYEFSEAKSFGTGSSSLVCVRNGETQLEK